MSVIENIKQRKSVRTYTGEPLNVDDAARVKRFITQVEAPFGAEARMELIRPGLGNERVKLGTYGYISGASDYLALIYRESPLAKEGAAYMFEQVLLFCTGLGLGTCWLGGSFSRKDFNGQVLLEEGECLKIVSPVGYAHEKPRLIEKLIGAEKNHRSRKPFGTLFFHKDFSTPLTEALAGAYAQPLEMVRLAPSANNKQSWRVVHDGEAFHFYKSFSYGFSSINLGIALCHFEQTCLELGLQGKFETRQAVPQSNGARYVLSWIVS